MQATHCALVVILKNFPNDLELESAKQHLKEAIALSSEYHTLYNSIYWNGSSDGLKRQIRANCNKLAFDTYTQMIKLACCLNKYAARKNAQGVSVLENWQQLILDLTCAMAWIETEHATEINHFQLALPI